MRECRKSDDEQIWSEVLARLRRRSQPEAKPTFRRAVEEAEEVVSIDALQLRHLTRDPFNSLPSDLGFSSSLYLSNASTTAVSKRMSYLTMERGRRRRIFGMGVGRKGKDGDVY